MIFNQSYIYYLVELRTWNDGTAFPYVRNREGYTKNYLTKENFKIIKKNKGAAQIQCGRFVIAISQFVFVEIAAARIHYENLKKLKDTVMQEAYEVSLLQVEATSIDKARVLPPNSYIDKNTIWLETFTPHLSGQEHRQQQSISNKM